MRIRPRLFIAGVTAFLCLLGLVALLSPVMVWDGHFELNMSIHSQSSQAIQRVSCALTRHRQQAEWLSQSDSLEATHTFKAVEKFDGKNATAIGRCSGREWWGIEYGYVADQFAVLRIDLENGKQVTTIVEIPKVRGPRSVTVEIP